MKHLFTLNRYFKKYKKKLLLGILFVILSNIFRVLQPQAIREALNRILEFIQSDKGQLQQEQLYSELMKFGFYIFGFALLMGLFMYMMRQTIIVMSRLIEYDLRKDVFQHYLKLDTAFYQRNKTGDLMSRITEDVNKVRMYLGPAMLYGINLISLVLIVIVTMFKVNFMLSLYTLLPLPFLSFIIYWVSNKINKKSEKIQQQLARLTTVSQESFSGIRIIKSYGMESNWKKDLGENARQYKDLYLGLSKIDALFFPSMLLLIGLSTLITIFVGGLNVYNGTVTPGNIAEFVIYVNMLTWPVSALGWCVSIIQQAEASQKRINDFLQTKPDIESNGMGHMPTNSLQIEFDRVDFQYPGSKTKALTNFSISIPQGSRIAIVGKTASGKTSIAELLLRLYDPSLGSIRLGGIDLKTLPVDFIRKQIAYVPQDVFLFSETIEDNIAFGIENQDPQLVRKAAEYASVAAEIEEFPDSYKSILGERGVNVSGGQKQRISLARAFIRDSPIILLDDCLSAVDSQTEQRIMEGFESYLSGKTVILITQRLKQTVYMDNILVLERGKLVQNGNFETLVKEKGLFSQLYEIERKAESNIQEN
ncbi:MAG: ABC transporter ATP-binding protein [Saprospiraceae bacterium]|nr:ABC transporter ATP-binding protein [Saprospiraceae bacterium]HRG68632.1 ABC transporter ATP-binding protein [Saprospiraceae bacterium]